MYNKAPCQLTIIIGIGLLVSSCVYFDRIKQSTHYKQIENNIYNSSLEETILFIGKAPFKKTYEFRFTNVQNTSFSLLFSVHESSFSDSTLKYLKADRPHRNANQINENIPILTALHKNLPKPNEVSWRSIGQPTNQLAHEGYKTMLDYIRYKIRDT